MAGETPERLVVSGTQLVSTKTGEPVYLRGINWGRWGYVLEGDAELVKGWGANVVRIPLRWDGAYPPGTESRMDEAPGHVNPEHLAIHDWMVDMAEAAGLWIIPFIDSDCGQNGLQDAATIAYCDPAGIYPNGRNFWRDPTSRAKYMEVLAFMANRLKDRERIAMFEPLPEPSPDGISDAAIRDFYAEAATVVRATGLGAPFLVGAAPAYSANRCDTAFNSSATDYVYTGNLFAYTDSGDLPTITANMTNRMQNLIDMRSIRNVPVLVQQWGVESGDDPTNAVFAHIGNSLNLADLPSTFWHMDDNTNATGHGLYYRDGAARVAKPGRIAALQKYFAGYLITEDIEEARSTMDIYLNAKNKAIDLLGEFGTPMTLKRGSLTVGTASGVFLSQTAKDETESRSSVLAQTELTTRKVLVSASVPNILVGDVLVADGQSKLVTAVETVRPTTRTVLFKLEVS